MKTQTLFLLLAGLPGSVANLLLAAKAAPRIARMSADNDGSQVAFELVPEFQADAAVEYKLEANDEPTTSIAIAIPNKQEYLYVEDEQMSEAAAEAIAATCAPLYADSQLAGTNSPEIYAPTQSNAFDRTVVRDSAGRKLADITLPGIDGQVRITAATAYSDDAKANPVVAIAAIGQPKVFAYDPSARQASAAFELDSPIVRAQRSEQDGSVAFKLENGRTAKVNVNEDGQLQLAAIEDAKTDEVPADAQGWQAMGRSYAVVDADGAPTSAFVKPAADHVAYRFAPKAQEAASPAK